MNRIFLISLIILLVPATGFSQKKLKDRRSKKHQKQEIVVDNQDVTNTFLDATKARITGDKAKAITLFQSCLQKNPDHAASMYELALIYLDQNETEQATNFAQRAAELEPGNKWYKLLLVDVYAKSGDKKRLLEICQQMVKDEPGNADYLYELANAYLANNEGSSAIKTYNQLEQLVGINEEISIQKYKIFLFQKKTDDAIAELQKLAAEFPEENNRYLSMIAETYLETGNDTKALEYYRNVLADDPSNPYIHITLSDFYRKKGDAVGANNELKLGFENPALDINTKLRILLSYYTTDEMYGSMKDTVTNLARILVKTHPGDAKAHSLLGDMLYNDKKYAEAVKEYRQVLTSDSSRYAVWESLLNAELQMADYESLARESAIVTELFPMQPVPYLFRGAALLNLKQPSGALDNFETGLKMVSGNNALLMQFYIYMGETQHQLKDYMQSDENFEKALKLDSENSYVLNNYAYYLSLRGDNLEKAEAMSAKSMKIDPQNPANMDTYGWILYKMGRNADALKWVEKAVSLSPKADPDLLEHLGDINFKLGNMAKAVELWKAALDKGSESEMLKKKVKDSKLYE